MEKDCFAYQLFNDGEETCGILTDEICNHKRCKFYKKKKEYDEGFCCYTNQEKESNKLFLKENKQCTRKQKNECTK